ncbi:MAG: hypothetical protein ACE5E9_00175 [Nitrospinaceae bacterium]
MPIYLRELHASGVPRSASWYPIGNHSIEDWGARDETCAMPRPVSIHYKELPE